MNPIRLRHLIALLLISITLFSCSKDESAELPLLPQKLERLSSGDDYLNFVYNADGTLKRADIKERNASNGFATGYTISYNTAKQMTNIALTDGSVMLPAYEEGVMAKVIAKDQSGAELSHTQYNYLNGVLKDVVLKMDWNGVQLDWMKFIFNYNAQGNITKTDIFITNIISSQLEFAGRVEYQYDNKPNPLYDLRDFMKLVWQAPSRNNITREVHYSKTNVVEEEVEYTYTYNSRNQPATARVTSKEPGAQPVVRNLVFSYR